MSDPPITAASPTQPATQSPAKAPLGWPAIAVSLFIATIIGLQLSTFITGTVSWPFMAYTMYSQPKSKPVQTTAFHVYVQFPGNPEFVEVTYKDSGLYFFAFLHKFIKPMIHEDAPATIGFLDRIERTKGTRPTAIRIDAHVHALENGEIVFRTIPHHIPIPTNHPNPHQSTDQSTHQSTEPNTTP